jgi:hypothetical protein
MPRYAFSIDVEAETEPMEVPVRCPDSAAAKRRAGELLNKYPPFKRISVWWEGQLLCSLDQRATRRLKPLTPHK